MPLNARIHLLVISILIVIVSRSAAQDVVVNPIAWLGPHESGDQLPAQRLPGAPKFPVELQNTTRIGWVEVDAVVDENGGVFLNEVAATLPLYEKAVRATFNAMKMDPARRSGKPIASRVRQVFIFNPASAAAEAPGATPRLLRAGVIVDPARRVASEAVRPDPEVVWVSTRIAADGRVAEVLAPTDRLTALVRAGLQDWQLSPARQNGSAREVAAQLPVLLIAPGGLTDGLIVPPKVLKTVPPSYPLAAMSARVQGEALITFIVEPDGSTSNVSVRRASFYQFGAAAKASVEKWKFAPARKDGVPVRSKMGVPIKFTIDDERSPAPESAGKGATVKSKGDISKLPEELQFDVPPMVWRLEQPKYPYALLAKGTSGSAQVAVIIGPDGKVAATKVLKASSPEFGFALQAAVEQHLYEPAIKNGDPTSTMIRVDEKFDAGTNGVNLIVSDAERAALRMETKHAANIAKATELDQALKPLYTPMPVYPRSLPEAVPGEAVVEFLVNEHGIPVLVRIVSASRPEFGYAAVQGISEWRFGEPTRSGKPVTVRVRVPVKFSPPAGYPNDQRVSVP